MSIGRAALHPLRASRRRTRLAGWCLLAAIALAVVVALAGVLDVGDALGAGYFALTLAALPAGWHDEWQSLPAAGHAVVAILALTAAAAVPAEVDGA